MTVADMHIGVNLGVQKVDSNIFSSLLPEEINYYLNKAQREYIRDQYVLLRGKYTDNGNPALYEKAQAAQENLRTLVTTFNYTNANVDTESGFDNVKSIDLTDPSDTYAYFVRAEALDQSGGAWTPIKLIALDEIQKFIQSKSNVATVFRDYRGWIEGNKILIAYDVNSGDVYEVNLTFIKQADELIHAGAGAGQVETSQLPAHTHDEIVDMAVNMILEDLKSMRPATPIQVEPEVD